ncbi:MAG: hypothetical protein ASARMPREDX12_009433 [Alectoria sarmentosa]|nr:MAG: hypothetical protein ASARMPREDX12_009433 [Alectoria sarmentosa]
MQTPRTRTKRPPPGFHPTNPSMDRPPSSEYGNPLTFNVAVMFLFYVLSVSLCLSSFSTCVCVVFNPVGTFRTIANYLFYALGLSVLLTFLFVALTGVYFDALASPESTKTQEIVEECHEPASQEAVDAMPVQEEHREGSELQEVVRTTPNQEAYREVSASQEIEGDVPVAGTSQQTALEDDSKKRSIDYATIVKEIPRLCEEISAPPEHVRDAAEQKENAPEAKAASQTEAARQDIAPANVITARESKKIENWISQTNLANIHAARAFCGMLNGDDGDDEGLPSEIVVWDHGDGGPLSETRSLSPDSDFQRALRVYMDKRPRSGGAQRRAGVSTPSEESGEESDFRDSFRKMFKLQKAGVVRRARSA